MSLSVILSCKIDKIRHKKVSKSTRIFWFYLGKETSVHDQDSAIDAMTQRQPIVQVGKEIDHLIGVFSFDLSFEAVHFVHVLALVVAARHEKVVGIQEFVAEQDENALDRERTAVHKVSVEQVGILFRRLTIQLENVHQVVILAMNISTDGKFLPVGNLQIQIMVTILNFPISIALFKILVKMTKLDMSHLSFVVLTVILTSVGCDIK